jgi:hypothetical protein
MHLLCTITESAPVDSGDIEDEEFEGELGKLEAELLEEEEQDIEIQKQVTQACGLAQAQGEDLAASVRHKLSSLNLEPEAV